MSISNKSRVIAITISNIVLFLASIAILVTVTQKQSHTKSLNGAVDSTSASEFIQKPLCLLDGKTYSIGAKVIRGGTTLRCSESAVALDHPNGHSSASRFI